MSDSPTFALSTMWYQGRFDSPSDFALAARRLGYENIEISYVVPPEGFEELAEGDTVRIVSLHAPTPRVKVGGQWSEALNLAALDDEERDLAVRLGIETMEKAARVGAHWVVFHLGGVGSIRFVEELELKRLYTEGVSEGEEVDALRHRVKMLRAEGALECFPRAQQSLAELAEAASRLGVAIGLEDRIHFHEFPNVDECAELLVGYPPELVGYWHDVGHAEVLDRIGLGDKYRWLKELGDRTLGAHVHDVEGIVDHRAPGHGDVDWDYIARYLPVAAPRTFEINQTVPEEQVAAAIGFLRDRGII
jgi:sugar phosphate isomerase/epimerase